MRGESSAVALLIGGVVGGVSHPLLDGLMHPDVRPLAPWSDANPLLGAIDLGVLHLACVIAGVSGALVLALRRRP